MLQSGRFLGPEGPRDSKVLLIKDYTLNYSRSRMPNMTEGIYSLI